MQKLYIISKNLDFYFFRDISPLPPKMSWQPDSCFWISWKNLLVCDSNLVIKRSFYSWLLCMATFNSKRDLKQCNLWERIQLWIEYFYVSILLQQVLIPIQNAFLILSLFLSECVFRISHNLFFISEHTKNSRKSTKDKHQKGQARKNKERSRGWELN